MLTRREFLRRSMIYALTLAGGSTLAACSPPSPTTLFATSTTTPIVPSATAPASATAQATVAMTATPVPPTAGTPYLVVARGTVPGAMVRAALDALGGIGKFVKPGNEVILKPNICNDSYGPEYATTTNPDVLAELVTLCLQAGAKRVRVMDQAFSGTAVQAYKKSGIRDAVEKAGGQMEIMTNAKYIDVPLPNGRSLKACQIYQEILKADVVINVPIAKQHGSAQVTLALKGLMGIITNRNAIHTALDQRIADLSTVIKPTLHLIDAVRVLTRNGPTGGSLDYVMQANTLIASHDPVATDAYATQLFFKKKPQDIGYIKFGAEMGLGRYDFDKLTIKEIAA